MMVLALVLAFSTPGSYGLPAQYGGGSGRLFTGSPSSKWDCSVCHDLDSTLTLDMTSEPASLFDQGYTPGQTYRLNITLGATATSTFGLDAALRNAQPAGVFANVDLATLSDTETCTRFGAKADPVVLLGGTEVQSGTCKMGLNTWHVNWTAPASEAGPVTFYISAVAGDGKASVANDRTVSRIFGAPSPASAMSSPRTGGCGAPAAMLLLPLFGVLVLRRRAALLLLVLVPLSAHAAKKKAKRAPPPVEQPAPAPAPAPVLAPEPEPPKAPPEELKPAPLVAPEPVVVAPVAAEEPPPPVDEGPTAVEATAMAGFGFRALAQYSQSFATPVRLSLGFPTASLDVRFYPARLMRASVLTGVEIEGSYQVGFGVGALPLGAANAIPADGRVAAGYRFTAGAFSIAPRFLFRMEVGGVDRNALFEDAYYQTVGGELSIAVDTGGFFLELRPGGGKMVDTGSASVRAYGPLLSGFTAGAVAAAGWRFGKSGLAVTAHYSYSFTRASFFGSGDRDYQRLTNVDQVHAGMLTFGVAR